MPLARPVRDDESYAWFCHQEVSVILLGGFGAQLLDLRMSSLRLENFPLQAWRARGISSTLPRDLAAVALVCFFPAIFDRLQQSLECERAIATLRARILHSYTDPAGTMSQGDCGRNFVDMLTSRAGGTGERFFQIGRSDLEPTETLSDAHSLGRGRRHRPTQVPQP
jgi:hypothetical protein